MAYTKQTWHDEPTEDTPLSAARLGHLEDGVEAAASVADAAETPTGAQTKASVAQSNAVALAATDATTKAAAAQAAAIAAAATDATTKASAAQSAATSAAATDATSKVGTETTRATTAEALKAPLASPTFTGVPAAPTAAPGTNTTQLATTAFVAAQSATSASVLVPTAVKTSSYTAAASDYVPVDTTSGNVTITLPTAPADKTQVGIKHVIRGGTNTVTLALGGSDVLNKTGGSTTGTLTLVNQAIVVQYKASSAIWYVVSGELPLSSLDARFDAAGAAAAVTASLGTAAAANTGTTSGTVPLLGTGGRLPIARLASGTATGAKYVRDDGTLAAPTAADVGAVPSVPVFTGVALSTWGHSYSAGSGSSVGSFGYVQRLNRSLGTGSLNAQGIGGYFSTDTTSRLASTAAPGNLVIWDSVINDAVYYTATNSKSTNGFTNAVRAFLDFAWSGTKIEESSSQVVYTGTWSTTAFAGASGASTKTTSTLGDSFNVSWSGDRVTLMLIGRDDSANGTAGATFTVSQGANTITTGTLSNQMKQGSLYTLAQVPVRISGFGPGYHTVTVTKTDATGSVLGFDCAVVPATVGPTMVFVKGVTIASGTQYSVGNSNVAALNAIIDTEIASSWVSGRRIVAVDPSTQAGWTTNTAMFLDGLHPSDIGHNYYAAAILSTLTSYGYLYGQNSQTFADTLVAAPSAVTTADNFTRADSSLSMGSTSTGAVPWQVETPNAVWGIVSNKAAPITTVANQVVTHETGRADGTITVVFGTIDGANSGIVFRCISNTSYLAWTATGGVYTGGNGSYAGVSATTGAAGSYAAGDTLTIVLAGSLITFKKNGTTTGTYTSTYNQTATRHGLWSLASNLSRATSFAVGP